MKVFKYFALVILTFQFQSSYACILKKQNEYYSLSGPVSMLFEFMGLEKDKQLKAISVFHPIKNFQGKKLGGGIFLSPKVFKGKQAGVVFYDESKELKKSLSKISEIKSVQIKTRGLNSFESTLKSLKKIRPFLRGCEKQIAKVKSYVDSVNTKINKWKVNKKVLFFLDHIGKDKKLPQTIMINDGFVLTLIHKNKISTYQSPLSYVAWSAKLMKNKYADYIRIGVKESNDLDQIEVQKIDEKHYNFTYKGALIPGISQLKLLEQLTSSQVKVIF